MLDSEEASHIDDETCWMAGLGRCGAGALHFPRSSILVPILVDATVRPKTGATALLKLLLFDSFSLILFS